MAAVHRHNRSRYSKVAMYAPLGEASGTAVEAQRNRLRWFAPDEFVNLRLSEDRAIDPMSSYWVPRLVAQATTLTAFNLSGFSWPVYSATPQTPRIAVDDDDNFMDQNDSPFKWGSAATVPWEPGWRSADAEISMSSYRDRHILIVDPSADAMWEMFQVYRKGADQTNNPHDYPNVLAEHGGKATGLSGFSGAFPNPYGSTGTGISAKAGLIMFEDVVAGVIPHVVKCAVSLGAAAHRAPATRGDQAGGANDVQEGSIFRLPYDFDVDAYAAGNANVTPLAKMVMLAWREYGLVVSDASTGQVVMYGQDLRPAPAYTSANAVWEPYLIAPYKSVTGTGDTFTSSGHGFANQRVVYFRNLTGGAGLTAMQRYFVQSATANTFKVSTDFSGTNVITLTTNLTAGEVGQVQQGFELFNVNRMPWSSLLLLPASS